MEEGIVTEKKPALFAKYNWLFAIAFGVAAVLALFGDVVTCKVADVSTGIHLWDYFTQGYTYAWSMYVTLGFLGCGILAACCHKAHENFDMAAALFFLVAMPMLALVKEFFGYNELPDVKSIKFGAGSAVSMILTILAVISSLGTYVGKRPFSVRDVAEDGVLIALAFVLNFIKIPVGATGGSINFQMLPLFIIALRHGPAHGLIAGGIAYGLLTCLTDGWGFFTYPFDYLVGFGSVMVLGFFRPLIFGKDQKWYNVKGLLFLALGGALATFVRFMGSMASSMVVYGLDFKAAAIYNSVYIPVAGAVAIGALMALYGPLAKLNIRFKPGASLRWKNEREEANEEQK